MARTHVMGGEVLISPNQHRDRLFVQRFKSVPTIEPLGSGRFKISGTTIDGKAVENEVALAA